MIYHDDWLERLPTFNYIVSETFITSIKQYITVNVFSCRCSISIEHFRMLLLLFHTKSLDAIYGYKTQQHRREKNVKFPNGAKSVGFCFGHSAIWLWSSFEQHKSGQTEARNWCSSDNIYRMIIMRPHAECHTYFTRSQ